MAIFAATPGKSVLYAKSEPMIRITVILILSMLLAGCAGADIVSPEKVTELLQGGAVLVDVRTKEEYEAGHLPEALLIPHTKIKENLDKLPQDKTRDIVVYCRSGRRSDIARKVLLDQGYVNVFNGGGYEELKKD